MTDIPEWAMRKAEWLLPDENTPQQTRIDVARALMSTDREATDQERDRCEGRLSNTYDAGVLSWDIFEEILRDIHSGAAIRKGKPD